MGRIRPGFQARVVDDRDEEVRPGEAGELILRADEPFAFSDGYFGMPDKTVEAWRNLWFHTGDRVVREADGSFRFVDRMKDAIRRRGENISSFEVEQVLLSHPSVGSVAVFPVRSEMAEDEVMAAIIPETGAEHRRGRADLFLSAEARLFRHSALHRGRRQPSDDGERQGSQACTDRTRRHGCRLGPGSARHPGPIAARFRSSLTRFTPKRNRAGDGRVQAAVSLTSTLPRVAFE